MPLIRQADAADVPAIAAVIDAAYRRVAGLSEGVIPAKAGIPLLQAARKGDPRFRGDDVVIVAMRAWATRHAPSIAFHAP